MSNLEFFKKQAKNLFKDWKTHTEIVEEDGFSFYEYKPKFFDIDELFLYFGLDDKDEKEFSLMKAQHMIAQIAGFRKWNDLIKASPLRLELAKIMLDNCKDSQSIEDWQMTSAMLDSYELDDFGKLEYAKQYFSDERKNIEYEEPEIELLSGTEREKELSAQKKSFHDLTMDSMVHCIHCGKKFAFKDANVIRYKGVSGMMPYVVCKYYPNCNGSLMDMFPDGEEDEYDGRVPFDWDMDTGYNAEYD